MPRDGANLSNWRLTPFSKWGFENVRQLIPTANIATSRQSKPLPSADSGLSADIELACTQGGNLEQYLTDSFSDHMVILRRGQKIYEWHAPHSNSNQPHIVFSVSKSITAMLAGILVEEGILDVTQSILHYLPGVKGSGYKDCSVQQLLDMTVALAFEESYLEPTGDYRRYRDATGWNAVDQTRPRPDLETFLYGLKKSTAEHGEVFDYKSPNSDLLGLLIERAAGIPFAELLSAKIWQPMGAETDAYVTVDQSQLARGAGGICVTVDDLARFGQLILDRGVVGQRQVIPASWIEDTMTRGDRDTWLKGTFASLLPNGCYRNQWYQSGDPERSLIAIGIHGQWLYINPASELVIARLSSQPEPLDDALDILTLKLFSELTNTIAN